MFRVFWALSLLGLVLALGVNAAIPSPDSTATNDWRLFDWTSYRSGVYPYSTRITAANLRHLTHRRVVLDGTVDASVIYERQVRVENAFHDAFFFTTTYGKTEAVDASTGKVLWRFTPPGYASWAGSAQITTATPAIGDARSYVYAAAPNGRIYKIFVNTGKPVWSVSVTRLPSREKIASSINFYAGNVIVTTGGYIGDAPPYQGHVVVIAAATGQVVHVWNSLCSNRSGLMNPRTCSASDSAIWGRSGAVVDPATSDLLVATGNAPFDGVTNWGDSVLRLTPTASAIVGNYTPTDTEQLNASDTDLGSTSPAVLDSSHVLQGGKDGKLRVLSVSAMAGTAANKGGELQVVSTPGSTDLFTAPAVWNPSTGLDWVFVADNAGTAAWKFTGGKLVAVWQNGTAGTSPVLAGGLLYVYDPNGGLSVYNPTTGTLLTTLACGAGHWNSPIAIDGRIALPEGNANDHDTFGVLDIWSVRK